MWESEHYKTERYKEGQGSDRALMAWFCAPISHRDTRRDGRSLGGLLSKLGDQWRKDLVQPGNIVEFKDNLIAIQCYQKIEK